MALSETARLIASLELRDAFSKQIGAAEKSLGSFDKKLDSTQTRAFRAGQQIGTGIRRTAALAAGAIGFLATNVALGVSSLERLETVTTQTNAVLKSTKGAAGENAQAIRDLAQKYEDLNATIDDTVIQSGENLLLTFTNIRKDAFEPALKAALDMNQALGGGEEGLQGTIQRIGRALHDPIKGLTQLSRVGVTFTKQQRDQIAAAVKAGDTFKAQGIILEELNKRFGGSFLAGGQTTAGKVAKFKDAIDDLQRALATALLPVIGKVADALQKFLADPKVTAAITRLGQNIAGLFTDANLAKGADFLKGAFKTAEEAAPIVEQAARATFGLVQSAVSLFKQLPPGLQGLLAGGFALNKLTGGLVTNIAGGIADLIGKSRGATPANPVFVADISGGLGGAGAAGAVGKGTGLIAKAVDIVQKVAIVSMVAEVAELIHGAISPGGGLEGRTQSGNLLPGDQLSWPFGPKNTPHVDLGPFKNIFGGDSAFTTPAPDTPAGKAADDVANRPFLALIGQQFKDTLHSALAGTGLGKAADDLVNVSRLQRAVGQEFTNAIKQLRKPRDDSERRNAAVELVNRVTRGLGDFKNTAAGLAALRTALKQTHDSKTAAIIRNGIRVLESKIPGRQYAQKQIDKVSALLRDGNVTRADLRKIAAIEADLKNHGLPSAARNIQARVDAAQRADVAAQRATTEAIKNKRLSTSTTVNIKNNVTTTTTVTAAGIRRSVQTYVAANGSTHFSGGNTAI